MTNNPLELYRYAEQQNIDVDWVSMELATSLSVPLPGGQYAIAINPWKMDSLSMETVCLAHELGHCETGSFYNPYAVCDVRRKHENRADKWAIAQTVPASALADKRAIRRLVPRAEYEDALADGCTTISALAERFGVTPEFMKKAVCLYTYGNLATDLYM